MSSNTQTQSPATTTPATRVIGRTERDFLYEVRSTVEPRAAILGRDYFVGTTESVEATTAFLTDLFHAEWKVEEEAARKARPNDASRGIPAWATFKKATEAKERLQRFEHELATARDADEAKRAERQAARDAKKAGTEAPEATEQRAA